jgi:hypothetical protein
MISKSGRKHSGFLHFAAHICYSYYPVALQIYHQEEHYLLGYLYNYNTRIRSQNIIVQISRTSKKKIKELSNIKSVEIRLVDLQYLISPTDK